MQLRNQNDILLSNRGETEWEVMTDVPLWSKGQRQARQTVAAQVGLIATAESQMIRLQLAGLVRDALWDIALMQVQAEVASNKRDAAVALLKDLETRVKLGDASLQELLIVKADMLNAQSEWVNADAEIQHAKFRYMNLTGLTEMPAAFAEFRVKRTLDGTHPLLVEAQQNIALNQSHVTLTQIESHANPVVSLSVRSIRGGFDNQSNQSMGLSIRLPLQVESYNAPQIANASAMQTQSEVNFAQLQLTLKAAFHEAEHNLEVGELQLNLLNLQLENAQQSLKIANTAYKLGELDLIQLLRVKTNAFQAEKQLKTQQTMQLWNTARYNQAVGELL